MVVGIATVEASSGGGPVTVVVSAMSGVTNRLIDAARRTQAGQSDFVPGFIAELRQQHSTTLDALLHDGGRRAEIIERLSAVLAQLERLLQGTALLRELTPRALDVISGIGERLSAPLLAGALCQLDVRAVPVSATEVIVTDPHHGRAEPLMKPTREKAAKILRPLLDRGIVPVVTGFIGAAVNGEQTTLGRGGSDYSATILGAALDAGETVIWTDVLLFLVFLVGAVVSLVYVVHALDGGGV